MQFLKKLLHLILRFFFGERRPALPEQPRRIEHGALVIPPQEPPPKPVAAPEPPPVLSGDGSVHVCIKDGSYRLLERQAVKWIVVHHCSLWKWEPPILDGDLTATKMIDAFTSDGSLGTGKAVPYHVLIRSSGMIEQMLRLTSKGAHARKHNDKSLSVCVVGESAVAPEWQYSKLVDTCVRLLVYIGGDTSQLVGHTELAGASRDANKKCPAPTVDMAKLRADVAKKLPRTMMLEHRLALVNGFGLVI